MKYIMLHGLGQTSSSWKNTVKAMNKNESDILCPDLSNWLNSEKASYSHLYQELEKYCEQFSEPLNLCGLSLGGILAMQYSIEHPQRVNSLVLIGVQYTMPKRLLQFQNIVFEIMPSSLFKKMGFRKRDLINLSKSMINLNFQQDLNKINCPVLIICGDKDKANKPASLQLKKHISHAEISIILNAGHEVNIDTPAELSKELNSYFNNDNKYYISEGKICLKPEVTLTEKYGSKSKLFAKHIKAITQGNMEIRIEHGTDADLDAIEQLYNDLHGTLEMGVNYPGWRRGIYPTREDAATGIAQNSLFVARSGGSIVGSIILNHKPENGYDNAKWQFDGDYSLILVVHTLVVHPSFVNMGIGAQLLRFAEKDGKQKGMKAIRLDVYENNTPAIALYQRCGYQYIHSVDLGFGHYGLDLFKLYEKLLSDVVNTCI